MIKMSSKNSLLAIIFATLAISLSSCDSSKTAKPQKAVQQESITSDYDTTTEYKGETQKYNVGIKTISYFNPGYKSHDKVRQTFLRARDDITTPRHIFRGEKMTSGRSPSSIMDVFDQRLEVTTTKDGDYLTFDLIPLKGRVYQNVELTSETSETQQPKIFTYKEVMQVNRLVDEAVKEIENEQHRVR